jgi:hypothetical protein
MIDLPNIFLHHLTDKTIKNKNKKENITDKIIKKAKFPTVKIITLIKFSHETIATTCRNILNVLANPVHALILIFKKTTTKNNQAKEKTTDLPIENKKNTGGDISSRNIFMKNQIKPHDIINFFNSSPLLQKQKIPPMQKNIQIQNTL